MNSFSIPGVRWQAGQILAFSALDGLTDYQEGLAGRTIGAPDGIEICDPGRVRLLFRGKCTGEAIFLGDAFSVGTSEGEVRGALLDAHHLLVEGPMEISGAADVVRCLRQGNRLLVGSARHFVENRIASDLEAALEARAKWGRSHSRTDRVPDGSRSAWERALALMKSQVYSPEGKIVHRWTTPDRWPHKDMWLWDTAFHAIGWRHIDHALAMEMIEGLLDLQRGDGFLTYRGAPAGPVAHLGETVTQPPVLAWAVQLVRETAPDDAWLARIYPRLCAYVQWDLSNRDTDGGGLCEWFIEADVNCRSGESGMDNSPRFDSANHLDAVDFNSYLARECEVLAEFADILGRPDEAGAWRERHRALCALIDEKLWSEEDQFYGDRDPVSGELTPVLSSVGFLPLICGAATPEKAAWLVRQLADPGKFGTPVPIPSIAVSDAGRYRKDMWRGPMWVNINWMVAKGLERYGYAPEAAALRDATRREIERGVERHGVFFEYYDDRREVEPPQLLRKGCCAPEKNPYNQVIHDFGWTATLYVDLLLSSGSGASESPSAFGCMKPALSEA
jgi:putative isomerase